MKKLFIKKIDIVRIFILSLTLNTVCILCGSTSTIAFPMMFDMNVYNKGVMSIAVEQKVYTAPEIKELSTDERIELATAKADEAIATSVEIQNRYTELITVKVDKTTHVENCLWEDCEVTTCMTNIATTIDYNYSNTTALYTNEQGLPVYGINAIRNLGIDKQKFIQIIAPFAQSSQKEFGIPASTIMAQAILESGWGKKVIGNNIFGIKATPSYKGPIVMTGTIEYYSDGSSYSTADYFRGYNSIGDAVYDYSKNVIAGNPDLYNGVITNNWIDSVYGLGPYATDPAYYDLVISVINDFDLTRYNNLDYKRG